MIKVRGLKDATKLLIAKDSEFADLFGGVKVRETLESLENDNDLKKQGNLVYIKENDKYYTYNKDSQWTELSISLTDIYTGETEPDNDNALWIDTTGETADEPETVNAITELQSQVADINTNLTQLNKLITTGIVPGTVTDSYRRQIMSEMGEPEKPDNAPDVKEDDSSDTSSDNTTTPPTVEPEEPDKTIAEPTVFHNAIKKDTAENFSQNRNDLIDGEMLFYTDKKKFAVYYQGKFYVSGSSSTDTGSASGGEGITADELQDIELDHLTFINNNKKYHINIDSNGELKFSEFSDDTPIYNSPESEDTWGKIYVSHLLQINSVFCGGEDMSNDKIASHSFIELSNASSKDINLNGIYILYSDGTQYDKNAQIIDENNKAEAVGFKWEYLALKGIIKANSTFLIRGKQCNQYKSSILPIKSYDMEWYINNNGKKTLMPFVQNSSSFLLCYGTAWAKNNSSKENKLETVTNLLQPYGDGKDTTIQGYIDCVGFIKDESYKGVAEGNGKTFFNVNYNKTLFIKWFSLEPAKQGNKALGSRKTSALWTYIDFDKNTEHKLNSDYKEAKNYSAVRGGKFAGLLKQYYYPYELKLNSKPGSSSENKDFFSNKTKFDKNKPNYLICSFGIQATDNSLNIKSQTASRCFNWISVGNYSEYIKIRKSGENLWKCYHSIQKNDDVFEDYINDTDYEEHKQNLLMFIDHYKSFIWKTSYNELVTTHKSIIHGLTAGTYEYQVCRDNDPNYTSEILSFTVKSNDEVTEFSFVHTTDQQGFNWLEYQAWANTADAIANKEIYNKYNNIPNNDSDDFSPALFTINTGDITQNGNRVNEWMDYYNGRRPLKNIEEMFTIGNNDLCAYDATKLTNGSDNTSKYNHINILRYYTFELETYKDTDNNILKNYYCADWTITENNKQITYSSLPIYSIYSFNFGIYHFISLNSEIAIASSKTYRDYESEDFVGDASYANTMNKAIEEWFIQDVENFVLKYNTEHHITNAGTNNELKYNCCKYIIVYMHEMPFTIVTNGYTTQNKNRSGSHLNTNNSNGTYRFSRLFKKYGIRLVFGGHKHTYSISKPIYDAPEGYINDDNTVNTSIELIDNDNYRSISESIARSPVIQVKKGFIPQDQSLARYEVVEKITAPIYVMSQASGYKLVSNKELPASQQNYTKWLLKYYPCTIKNRADTENPQQHNPMYIRYDLSSSAIKITAKQVLGIWNNVNQFGNKKGTFDINHQNDLFSVQSVTLDGEIYTGEIESEKIQHPAKDCYGQTDNKSFIIDLV